MAQDNPRLVGTCEGCEAVLEYGNRDLSSLLVLPDYENDGQQIHISGVVYQPGGQEPAANVVLYVYHTNQAGIYPKRGDETGWGRRHGYIRGWVRTDAQGRYEIHTLRPASYPDRDAPQHIHLTVLEPDGKYYWMEDFLFADDPNLKGARISRKNPRGGQGFVLEPEWADGHLNASRNIVLGKNIPGYSE